MLNFILVSLLIVLVGVLVALGLRMRAAASVKRTERLQALDAAWLSGCYPVETLEQLRASLKLQMETAHFDGEKAFYESVLVILGAWCGRERYIHLLKVKRANDQYSSDMLVRAYAYRYSEIIERVELARIG